MRRSNLFAIAALTAFFGLLLTFFLIGRTADAQRDAGVRWEYAAITGAFPTLTSDNPSTTVSASANICYMQAAGCLNEEVKADLTYSKFFQDVKLDNSQASRAYAQTKAVENALSKAIVKLGAEGWELVSTPATQFMTFLPNPGGGFDLHEGTGDQRTTDIYFKRQRR